MPTFGVLQDCYHILDNAHDNIGNAQQHLRHSSVNTRALTNHLRTEAFRSKFCATPLFHTKFHGRAAGFIQALQRRRVFTAAPNENARVGASWSSIHATLRKPGRSWRRSGWQKNWAHLSELRETMDKAWQCFWRGGSSTSCGRSCDCGT